MLSSNFFCSFKNFVHLEAVINVVNVVQNSKRRPENPQIQQITVKTLVPLITLVLPISSEMCDEWRKTNGSRHWF